MGGTRVLSAVYYHQEMGGGIRGTRVLSAVYYHQGMGRRNQRNQGSVSCILSSGDGWEEPEEPGFCQLYIIIRRWVGGIRGTRVLSAVYYHQEMGKGTRRTRVLSAVYYHQEMGKGTRGTRVLSAVLSSGGRRLIDIITIILCRPYNNGVDTRRYFEKVK